MVCCGYKMSFNIYVMESFLLFLYTKLWMVTGHFANESFGQRLVRHRPTGQFANV